jgi:hypothetical protein
MSEQPKEERAPDENAAKSEDAVKNEYAEAAGLGGAAPGDAGEGQSAD